MNAAPFRMTFEEFYSSSEDNAGRCALCGEWASDCEPDARKRLCESCGKHGVFGLEELMLMGLIEIEGESE